MPSTRDKVYAIGSPCLGVCTHCDPIAVPKGRCAPTRLRLLPRTRARAERPGRQSDDALCSPPSRFTLEAARWRPQIVTGELRYAVCEIYPRSGTMAAADSASWSARSVSST
jgi:hypothetical protein